MAAIVRPDDYDVLMRRIGYSVALEPVPLRTIELFRSYAETGVLDRSSWYGLTNTWKMESGSQQAKKKRAEHFLDVISALGYVEQSGQILSPQPPLDAGAILIRLFSQKAQLPDVLTGLQIAQMIESDADLFLNVLLANGNLVRLNNHLNDVIRAKRELLLPQFASNPSRDKIVKIIDFASADKPKRLASFSALCSSYEDKQFSGDLLAKAMQTRGEWGRKMGLLNDNDGLSLIGRRLIDALEPICTFTKSGGLIFWPYDYQLAAIRLNTDLLSRRVPIPSVQQLHSAVQSTFLTRAPERSVSPEEILGLVRELFDAYRQLNPGRGVFRDRLPISALSAAFPPASLIVFSQIPDPYPVLEAERKSKDPMVLFVRRSGSEGMLLFRDR